MSIAKSYLLCFPLDEVGFHSLAVGDHQVGQGESGFTKEGVLGEVFLLLSVRVVVHADSYLVTVSCKKQNEQSNTAGGCKRRV